MFDETTITFKEYKETYYELRLNEHLKEYDDYDDLTFIEQELSFFRKCLESTKISVVRDIQKNGDLLIAYNKKIYELMTDPFLSNNMDSIEDLNYYYNFEIGKKLKTSFPKIIKFLQEKEIIINKTNEYKSNFIQPDATILAMLDGIELPKNDSEKIQQSEKYLYLKETAKEYIEKHDKRLEEFLDEFEADEMDYIKKEMEYFENTLYDVQNSEGSHDGHSVTGYDNFSAADELVFNIGYDKFMYSTNKKLKFLESKIIVDSPYQNGSKNESNTKETEHTLFNGKKLNIAERYTIANKIFGFEKTFKTLNISDDEKYKILSYVLNCNKDNARHVMNGTYKAKERDLTNYFASLNLNK